MRIENERIYTAFKKTETIANEKEMKKENAYKNESKDVYRFSYDTKEMKENMKWIRENDIRTEKIEEIQKRKEKGEYHITGKDVVLKMMEEK